MRRMLALMAALMLAGCGAAEDGKPAPATDTAKPANYGITADLVADFTFGLSDADAARMGLVSTYIYAYDGDLTPQKLTEGLERMTGLTFGARVSTDGAACVVRFAEDSDLFADETPGRSFFAFSSADEMRWFMLDSLWRTVVANLAAERVVFRAEGGGDLSVVGMSPVGVFGADEPYPGSGAIFARAGASGGNPSNVDWWGEYENDYGKIYISNYDGAAFYFQIVPDSGSDVVGKAAVDQSTLTDAAGDGFAFALTDGAKALAARYVGAADAEGAKDAVKAAGTYTKNSAQVVLDAGS
ncbi:MAG: hypothetical protein LBK41_04345 [Clostridiales bacterium]|jgi:hypothetical protein|nr:hypothetical protein [Clostridiales bacterium]